jgi:hypothetical protein
MRRVSQERPQKGQAASNKNGSKEKAAVTEGKERRRSKKKEEKALKKGEAGRRARGQGREERAESPACNRKEQAALDLLNNLGAKGGGLGADQHGEEEEVTRSRATSGGECSGQKTPD